MKKSDMLLLWSYNRWATERVLRAAASVSAEQFTTSPSPARPSLHDTLVHMLSAEWLWQQRCAGGQSPTTMLTADDFPTLAALQERWQQEMNTMEAWLRSLSDDDLQQPVRYTTTSGVPFSNLRWHILLQLVNHGTQHRSEAALLLTEYDRSPGNLDLIIFLREYPSGAGS